MMKILFILSAILVALPATFSLSRFSDLELRAYEEVKVLYDFAAQVFQGKSTALKFSPHGSKHQGVKKLGKFVYTNCADPSTENVVVSNLSVSPDPIKIPGNITISGDLLVKTGFGSPLKVQLGIWKEIFGVWVKVPCVDQFGSCSYDDFCTILAPATCPPVLQKIGLRCNCPFTAGSWKVPAVTVDVTASLPVPISGGVKARLEGGAAGKMLTCVEITLDLD